jgi:hypothetical protein
MESGLAGTDCGLVAEGGRSASASIATTPLTLQRRPSARRFRLRFRALEASRLRRA